MKWKYRHTKQQEEPIESKREREARKLKEKKSFYIRREERIMINVINSYNKIKRKRRDEEVYIHM